MVAASIQGQPKAVDVLLSVASVAGDLGGRASKLGELQPAIEETDEARAARSLAHSLLRAVGTSGDPWACGWEEIQAELLPQPELVPLPVFSISAAMQLIVGDGDARPRELQQVGTLARNETACATLRACAALRECRMHVRRKCST